jgi:hypothetical protein
MPAVLSAVERPTDVILTCTLPDYPRLPGVTNSGFEMRVRYPLAEYLAALPKPDIGTADITEDLYVLRFPEKVRYGWAPKDPARRLQPIVIAAGVYRINRHIGVGVRKYADSASIDRVTCTERPTPPELR